MRNEVLALVRAQHQRSGNPAQSRTPYTELSWASPDIWLATREDALDSCRQDGVIEKTTRARRPDEGNFGAFVRQCSV